MPWAKFDDRYPWHRKVRPLSDAAFRLDVSAVCWCAENLTDGVIEAEFLTLVSDVRNPRKVAAELVRSGRWHDDHHDCESCPQIPAGAHIVHDYLDYNPTREKVERDREQRRKAGEKGGVASGRARSKTEATAASSVTNPRTRTPSPTPTTSVRGGSHVSSGPGTAPPRFPDHCPDHADDPVPPKCGGCAKQKALNAARPPLAIVRDTKRCIVHDETYTTVCRGCRADAIARTEETA